MADESIIHLEDPVDAAKNNIELILKENTKLKRIIVELRKVATLLHNNQIDKF